MLTGQCIYCFNHCAGQSIFNGGEIQTLDHIGQYISNDYCTPAGQSIVKDKSKFHIYWPAHVAPYTNLSWPAG